MSPAGDPRLRREAEFHDHLFQRGGREGLGAVNRLQGAARRDLDRRIREAVPADVVLELGVGRRSRFEDPALRGHGAAVAVDVSEVAVGRASAVTGGEVSFLRADAQRLPLRDRSVDVCVGSSIVHHLDVAVAAREIARVLRHDGRALLLEPRAGSPLLRLFRRLTPSLRSADERPLEPGHVAEIARWFRHVEITDHALTTQVVAPVLRWGRGVRLVDVLDRLDRALLRRFPVLGRWAWITVLDLRGPVDRHLPGPVGRRTS